MNLDKESKLMSVKIVHRKICIRRFVALNMNIVNAYAPKIASQAFL